MEELMLDSVMECFSTNERPLIEIGPLDFL